MNVSSVNFAGNVAKAPAAEKEKGGTAKGVASAFVPGLGQFIDGRNKEGAKFLGGSVAIGAASGLLSTSMFKKLSENLANGAKQMPKVPGTKMAALAALCLAGTALWIANIVDAYKGGKEKTPKPAEEAPVVKNAE